ncbi:TetR/AcrR family transcriptional regulator [Virgibacillus sp. LDC1]|jgi:AcrR family transcriptional regulator|uniref:TetR/AcrR family transcriptional regulator n=1 Tax=Paenibacillus sp. GM2FR TaxID=2059268 RepID=UPI000C27F560|nr:TetR/AcrR family transcriptional regulator [Paenibacillus sp. GM2FR]MCV4235063.1 TetR/AcrR family transcriptional regulator [Virgibacillus sp. LDC1]PJN49517.1 HTH-type transcriptional repressor ComR [Paenibacillus sp. GM2FR]
MGRNREFDVDQALDAALCVFWRKGYEGASYTDLTQATGVERPALYSAFGNKEALFRRVLERYYEHYHDFFPAALELPTSREVVAHIFRGAAELQTRYPDHKGCLYVHGDLAGSDDAEPIRRALIDARADGEASLRDRFERAKQEGDLPETANCAALAAFVMAVLHGMAVQAKAGFSRNMLEAVAEQALSTWPTGKSTLATKSS